MLEPLSKRFLAGWGLMLGTCYLLILLESLWVVVHSICVLSACFCYSSRIAVKSTDVHQISEPSFERQLGLWLSTGQGVEIALVPFTYAF